MWIKTRITRNIIGPEIRFTLMSQPGNRTAITLADDKTKYIMVDHDIHTISESWFAWQANRVLIQNAFPYMNDEQREFIKTGITPAEWRKMFAEELEEKRNNPL